MGKSIVRWDLLSGQEAKWSSAPPPPPHRRDESAASALTRHFCYRAGVVASLKMLPKVKVPRRSENEETDQADYASRSDGCNQPTLSSGGSQRKKVDSG